MEAGQTAFGDGWGLSVMEMGDGTVTVVVSRPGDEGTDPEHTDGVFEKESNRFQIASSIWRDAERVEEVMGPNPDAKLMLQFVAIEALFPELRPSMPI